MSKIIKLVVTVSVVCLISAAAFFPGYFVTGQATAVLAGVLGLWIVAVVLKLLLGDK